MKSDSCAHYAFNTSSQKSNIYCHKTTDNAQTLMHIYNAQAKVTDNTKPSNTNTKTIKQCTRRAVLLK